MMSNDQRTPGEQFRSSFDMGTLMDRAERERKRLMGESLGPLPEVKPLAPPTGGDTFQSDPKVMLENDPYGFMSVGMTPEQVNEDQRDSVATKLIKYGLPIALTGLAFALAEHDEAGSGPEAAVASMSAYLQGTMAAGQQRRKQILAEKELLFNAIKQGRTERLGAMKTLIQEGDPSTTGGLVRAYGQEAGIPPGAMAGVRPRNKVDEQTTAFVLKTLVPIAFKGNSYEQLSALPEMLERVAPELAAKINPLIQAAAESVKTGTEAKSAAMQILSQFTGPGDAVKLAEYWGNLDPKTQASIIGTVSRARAAEVAHDYRMEEIDARAAAKASSGGGGTGRPLQTEKVAAAVGRVLDGTATDVDKAMAANHPYWRQISDINSRAITLASESMTRVRKNLIAGVNLSSGDAAIRKYLIQKYAEDTGVGAETVSIEDVLNSTQGEARLLAMLKAQYVRELIQDNPEMMRLYNKSGGDEFLDELDALVPGP